MCEACVLAASRHVVEHVEKETGSNQDLSQVGHPYWLHTNCTLREGGREGGRERVSEGGREGGREGEREGERE